MDRLKDGEAEQRTYSKDTIMDGRREREERKEDRRSGVTYELQSEFTKTLCHEGNPSADVKEPYNFLPFSFVDSPRRSPFTISPLKVHR